MISTKGRYAIRLMIDLSNQNRDVPTPLVAIAERQNISKKYLEAIAKILVTGKLVKATSGKGGGYALVKDPSEYTIWEILNLTEESMASVACLMDGASECPRENVCQTVSMWRGYDNLVKDYFSNITIEDLAKNKMS